MAQITYADKTALYQNADVAAENKVRDVDMNEIKQVVNDNETKILLDVTDTAPAECSTGDMYFDTTDNLIYTATATDTWSSTGVAPTENTIYVVLTTQTSYMYDGNTLVSVGGGSGSSELIMVDPDVATADTKLYIEESDLDFQGLEIADEYTTGDNVAYSADYSNSAFGGKVLWTNPSPTSNFASQNVSLSSSNYDILEIYFYSSTSKTNTDAVKINLEGKATIMKWWNGGQSKFYERNVSINSNDLTSLTFGSCEMTGVGTQNGYVIPYKIIGYKTGLFS